MRPEARDISLVIAGHGSGKTTETARSTLRHAAEIDNMGVFRDVQTVFWRQPPSFGDASDLAIPEKSILVPHFIGPGYITDEKLPEMSGFPTERIAQPVGMHPEFARLLREHVLSNLPDAQDTTLFLVGHGNTQPDKRGSFTTTNDLARKLDDGSFASVKATFLEEAPFVHDWHDMADTRQIAVVPLMISNGNHGAVDIPQALGIDPKSAAILSAIETGQPAGPFEVNGHAITWLRAIGIEPFITRLMVDLALETLDALSARIAVQRLA